MAGNESGYGVGNEWGTNTAQVKTTVNDASVSQFLDSIADEQKRADASALVELMRRVTKAEPKMWGSNIIGFGDYHYVYETGREGDTFLAGFSPRKDNLTLYAMGGSTEQHPEWLAKLGKYSLGKGCLYIKRLDDVDKPTLKKLISESVKLRKQTRASMSKAKKK